MEGKLQDWILEYEDEKMETVIGRLKNEDCTIKR